MKKTLSILSALLILVMMMAIPVSAAEETPDYKRNYGQATYTANKLTTAPVIDGKVSTDEYGKITATKTKPVSWFASVPLEATGEGNMDKVATVQPAAGNDYAYLMDMAPKKFDTWFAYDDEYVYIAYEQLSSAWDGDDEDTIAGNSYNEYNFRGNYVMRVGFNMEFANEYLQIHYSMPAFTDGYAPLTVTNAHSGIKLEFSMGNPKGSGVYQGDVKIVEEAMMSKFGLDGTPFTAVNSKIGQHIERVELKLSKKGLVEAFNEMGGTDYEEFPDAMWFFFGKKQYYWGDANMKTVAHSGQTQWFGTTLTEAQSKEWAEYTGVNFTWFPDLVMFGDKINVPVAATTAPTTTAPTTTAPTTTAPVTTAPADDVTTAAPAVTTAAPEAKGGCGGMITFGGVALVATLGTCAVFVEKKRKH